MKILFMIVFFSQVVLANNPQESKHTDLQPYFFAVIVNDLDSSLVWYANNLQFEVLKKAENQQIGFKQANLKSGKVLLELIELKSALKPQEFIENYNNKTRLTGIFKIGLLVPDFDDRVEQLKQSQVTFNGRVVNDPLSGKKTVIILDPDNNRIQLFEE